MNKNSNQISVCMITTGFPVIKGDNSGIFIKKLVDQLSLKVKLTILVPSHREEFVDFQQYNIVRVRYFFRRLEKLFYSARGLPQELKRNWFALWELPFFFVAMLIKALIYSRKNDIVHVQWIPTGIFGILPKIIYKKPLVVSVRGSDVTRIANTAFGKILTKFVFKYSDIVVVVSNSFKEKIHEDFPLVNAIHIPNGIDEFKCSEQLIIRNNKVFSFLYVGNLVVEKGILDLQWAFEKLIQSGQKAKLTLVGNGDLIVDLHKWAKKKSNIISIKGLISHSEVIGEMKKADALILPSYGEGRPNVILEAISNYLPVIGTKIEGISEIITDKESGILFPPGDKIILSEILIKCVKGEYPLKQYTYKAIECFKKENYSWERTSEEHFKVYKSLMNY